MKPRMSPSACRIAEQEHGQAPTAGGALASIAQMPGISSAVSGIMGAGRVGRRGCCLWSASDSASPAVASHTARISGAASSSART
jgi:hypothetical protein